MTFPLAVDEAAVARVSTADPTEATARVAWNTLVEPGDRLAGALVATYGAVEALEIVVDPARSETTLAGLSVPRDREALARAFERWRAGLVPEVVARALTDAHRHGVRLLLPGEPDWPVGVDDLGEHAPLVLWTCGTGEALRSLTPSSIALVGARAATGYGEHMTMEASAGLVDRGYTIVSGAAYGIDGMAHRAALASRGTTVAFLAGGLDRFYPSGHEALLTRIAETGAIVSEAPCGLLPTRWRFLARNRLIAAASRATVVVEAGWRSGSLNTAGHASQLGRPLGAVPGPVTSAASAGCHRLVRENDAVLVTTADEMAELAPLDHAAGPVTEHTLVLDALSLRVPRGVSEVAQRAGLALPVAQAVLGLLALEGRAVERGERGWVRREGT